MVMNDGDRGLGRDAGYRAAHVPVDHEIAYDHDAQPGHVPHELQGTLRGEDRVQAGSFGEESCIASSMSITGMSSTTG